MIKLTLQGFVCNSQLDGDHTNCSFVPLQRQRDHLNFYYPVGAISINPMATEPHRVFDCNKALQITFTAK